MSFNFKKDTQTDKQTSKNNLIRLLCLIAVTMVIFCLYRFLINQYYFEIVLGIYMGVTTVSVLTYVIYNRGFSRKGITEDMLPSEWTQEQKREFIDNGEMRLQRSKWLLVFIIAILFTFIVEAFVLFVF